jgi:hypothetical protein
MTREVFVEYVNAMDFARLSKSHMEISDHIAVLMAIVGAMVTRASVASQRDSPCNQSDPSAI